LNDINFAREQNYKSKEDSVFDLYILTNGKSREAGGVLPRVPALAVYMEKSSKLHPVDAKP
jgi:hypothetical protein